MHEPGWYDDPHDPSRMRWYDGSAWTDNWRSKTPPPPPPSPGSAASPSGDSVASASAPPDGVANWSPPPARTFGEAVRHCFKNYATFAGRASRSEFWWFALFLVIASIAPAVIDLIAAYTFISDNAYFALADAMDFLSLAVTLGTFLPSLAVSVRRAHDVGHSGWFVLIPVYNVIYPFRAGSPTPNRFG